MKRSQGQRIHWESLQPGERYIMRTSSGEALVKVDVVVVTGIGVTIEDGQVKSLKQSKTFRKGDTYVADPSYAEFFEPTE
jgi:hypothetical protein